MLRERVAGFVARRRGVSQAISPFDYASRSLP